MEPFVPIPGKPPRKVVIDRQRKLFASLNIEELLFELVNIILIVNTRVRALTIKILKKLRRTGYPWSRSMTQSTTADSQKSGSPTVTTRRAASTPSQARAFGGTKREGASGGQFS